MIKFKDILRESEDLDTLLNRKLLNIVAKKFDLNFRYNDYSFFWLDEDSLRESIKNDEGYEALASYDGNVDEVYTDGVLYLIIRTD